MRCDTSTHASSYYQNVLSDAGIREAYGRAANYFFLISKNYAEGERRLYKLYESFDILPAYEAKSVVDMINTYLSQKNELTEGMNNLINLRNR
jgi:hypothetical protein